MSRINTSRSVQPAINMNMPVGRPVKLTATQTELKQINEAIIALSQAKGARSESELLAAVTEAFRLTRNISRSRIL